MARASRAVWAKRVGQWKASGLTGAAFAARLGVKEATLRHWRWQLGHARKTSAPAFVEVLGPMVQPQIALEVRVGEVQVVVPVGFDDETLRRLMRVLEER
jgi:hypothetical protein